MTVECKRKQKRNTRPKLYRYTSMFDPVWTHKKGKSVYIVLV